MGNWESVLKEARNCHTKTAWGLLFDSYSDFVRKSATSKPVHELFRILSSDPQCLQYDMKIWTSLLEACLSSWDLQLGCKVADFVSKTTLSPATAAAAAKVYIESGQPSLAAKIANRALRAASIDANTKLELQMSLCHSYVDIGKRNQAIKILNNMPSLLESQNLKPEDRAQAIANMARTNFFLGRYIQAAEQFKDAYKLYLDLENWYEAARSVYNAGSAYFNAGDKHHREAYRYVEECRQISEGRKLMGPLSHVEAFYGHDAYWHGNFALAREHYRRAHKYIPTSDKSFRTLHVLSMLAFIYLRTGQYKTARHFGQRTIDLAELGDSERFSSRYHNLEAELMWENGEIEKSQKFLREKTLPIIAKSVNTLEEMSTVSRYYLQSAKLLEDDAPSSVKISEQLKKNTGDWLEFIHAQAQFQISQGELNAAKNSLNTCLDKAKSYGDRYHKALALLGLIQINFLEEDSELRNNLESNKSEKLLEDLEIAIAKLAETPLKVNLHFIRAGLAYRRGDFRECRTQLQSANSITRISFADRYVLDTWLATLDGKAIRITTAWQRALVSHYTKIYFSPSIKFLGDRHFEVSKHYITNLARNPALSDLLEYLLTKSNFKSSPASIQQDVWHQSLNQLGWQQKIRNNLMRLRDFFPFTMAPLILHQDSIELFSEAIEIQPIRSAELKPKEEILRLLREGPMSTVNLSNRINVSTATTKRLLKKLSEEQKITVMKVGRKVLYQAFENRSN